jgi:intracellular septation protein
MAALLGSQRLFLEHDLFRKPETTFRDHALGTGPTPMRTALYQLGEDFLTTIVFLIAYLATGNLYLAVILAIVVGVGQFVLLKRRGRTPDVMSWLSLGLAMALGAATLITSDSRFIMAKPSVIHFAIGVVMLRRGWMARYMPEIVKQNVPERVLIGCGYAWAALMFVLGALNLYVAARYSVEVWAWFISVGCGRRQGGGVPDPVRRAADPDPAQPAACRRQVSCRPARAVASPSTPTAS